jgi:hypothetical protein
MRNKEAIRERCEQLRDLFAAAFLETPTEEVVDSDEYLEILAKDLEHIDTIEWALCDRAMMTSEMEEVDLTA